MGEQGFGRYLETEAGLAQYVGGADRKVSRYLHGPHFQLLQQHQEGTVAPGRVVLLVGRLVQTVRCQLVVAG